MINSSFAMRGEIRFMKDWWGQVECKMGSYADAAGVLAKLANLFATLTQW
jgi:hypothetical protein